MSWTAERVEALKKHWDAGLSCTEVACELGSGITRNAVIGKLHRLGISERSRAHTKPKAKSHARPPLEPGCIPAPKPKRARIVAKIINLQFSEEEAMETQHTSIPRIPLVARPPIVVPQEAPQCDHVTIMQLNSHTCRFPISDDPRIPTDEFLYCGAPTGIDASYCPYHQRLSYTGASPRRDVVARPRG